MTTEVRTELRPDGVAVLTLDGGDGRNAFGAATGRALGEAYARCDADDDVRAVVLTGAGSSFCVGADLASADVFGAAGESFSASPVDPPAFAVRKLVVAALNGHAIGIGLTLALQCDVRIVAADAKLAIPQVRRGMLGDAASHWTLPRLAGRAVAAELLLTGRTLSGTEAVARGLATEALPAADVLPAALVLAADVAVHANPASVALSKRLLWSDLGPDEIAAAETDAHRLLMGTPDAAEGPAAWRERRTPEWTSRVSDLPPLD
ncbi:enoyl-CoA hydratase/isomerase family protein [Nocardioides mangrovi]|uniref:Enoyl-CoA hydratase/isomerase family protein n=1 Tax=Nocardioides mangrovi TaxID=2874580 RepID=A0ABS7UDU3_9ACTN|nr:enoyl-CoA hydratase-related protein [Nocardioides mangrovi]MBZ5739173.1 enoyl-CoA hydratase/isomerase family protein [Nocardioides mangrovi]